MVRVTIGLALIFICIAVIVFVAFDKNSQTPWWVATFTIIGFFGVPGLLLIFWTAYSTVKGTGTPWRVLSLAWVRIAIVGLLVAAGLYSVGGICACFPQATGHRTFRWWDTITVREYRSMKQAGYHNLPPIIVFPRRTLTDEEIAALPPDEQLHFFSEKPPLTDRISFAIYQRFTGEKVALLIFFAFLAAATWAGAYYLAVKRGWAAAMTTLRGPKRGETETLLKNEETTSPRINRAKLKKVIVGSVFCAMSLVLFLMAIDSIRQHNRDSMPIGLMLGFFAAASLIVGIVALRLAVRKILLNCPLCGSSALIRPSEQERTSFGLFHVMPIQKCSACNHLWEPAAAKPILYVGLAGGGLLVLGGVVLCAQAFALKGHPLSYGEDSSLVFGILLAFAGVAAIAGCARRL
jgi:hypothetical protein